MNKPLLSISILVSNRIDTIRKCMESIKPLLTGFPCELIAIDTVGENTDGSIDVVREYTDKIYRFEWCNDFAKARNFGLDKCSGEWFMFMDDDEWFEDATELVEFFISGEYKKYNCANYKIRSYSNQEGQYSVATLFRMVKVEKNTRFEGRIHEHIVPLKEPAKEFSSYVHHYGYVFDSEEKKVAHSKRNISLLEPDYEKSPWNMHIRVQLLQEYIFLEELNEKAERLCKDTLGADKVFYQTNEFQWCLYAYVKLAYNKENHTEVVERAEYVRNKYPLNVLSDIAISTLEVSACYKLEEYFKTVELVYQIKKNRKKLQDNSSIRQNMLFMDFSTFLEAGMYCEVLKKGASSCYRLNDRKRAEELTKECFGYLNIPVLTVSVLVSNHKNTVQKCMESLQPLLKAIPSELIVVDTVGEKNSDGSFTIAKKYASKVIHFDWCDDFAAARNTGLKEAKGEWFLYLDDDEWFENVEELVRFFTSGEYLEYNSATYNVRNYQDLSGESYTENAVGRMVHRFKKLEFFGCVNETFNIIYTPCKKLTSYVHHYGFVYPTPEAKHAKMQYTLQLLQKDLNVYPNNLRNRLQLSIVLSVRDPERAVALCEDTLKVCIEKKETEQYRKVEELLAGLHAKGFYAKAEEVIVEKEIVLSISLLVSNNIGTIEKCMESLRPILGQIPSELIVVDTVGEENSDGSLAVARKYATKVVHFDWCNDFAAARNAGLEQATGKWFMFLDDDEWFEDVSEIVDFFRSGEYLQYSSGSYLIRNYTNTYGSEYSTASLVRMTKRNNNTRFTGEIHETFQNIELPCKVFSAYVHHYGYAYADENEKQAHIKRNITLLEKELEKNLRNLRMRAQMALELATFDNERAMAFCKETFRLCGDKCKTNYFQWMLSLVFRLHEALGTEIDVAEKSYNELKQRFGFNKTAENAICYQMTRICIIKERPERACPYIKKYFEILDFLRNHPKEQQLQMTADFARYQTEEAIQEMHRFDEYCNYKTKEIRKKQSEKQPDWIKSDIKLTIGVLVSNNINTIRKCMESLKPILEAVSSELLVVDTVGEENSDGSLEIAKEYATKVIHFDWCDDFSAARNVCIDHARGEWFLYVDDDEWFDDASEIIEFFNCGESNGYGQAAYYMHNLLANGNISQTLMGRFVRRTEQTRFIGKVHERISNVYPPCKQLTSIAYHSGYCYESEDERKKHQQRNHLLLEQEIKEKGYTPHLCAQMVQELLHVQDTYDEGYEYCKKCLPVLVEQGEIKNPCTQWLIFGRVRYFSMIEDDKHLLEEAEFVRNNYYLSETTQMAIAGAVSRSAWLTKNYEKTEEYTALFLKNREWLNRNPDQILEQNALDFSAFFTDEPFITVLSIAGMCANKMEKYELANRYWKQMPWDKVENTEKVKYWNELNKTMEGLKQLQERQRQGEKIKELFPLVQTMKEAEICAVSFAGSGNMKELAKLLSGMQEVAIAVGTNLDQIVGEGSAEVSLLEEYCEQVWQCSNAETKDTCLNKLKEIQKLTEAVEEKLKERL